MDITKAVKNTGRTTRMLEHAIALAEQTKRPVYVLFKDQESLRNTLGPNFQNPLIWARVAHFCDFLDFKTLECKDPEFEKQFHVLIDHAVYEMVFEKQLRKLHQYDQILQINMEHVLGLSVNTLIGFGEQGQVLQVQLKNDDREIYHN